MRLGLEAGHVVLDGREILCGVDLRLCPGELVGIVGPNGAGKSTLLRVLAGLLPPARGHVVLDALALARLPPRARARRVAYLPQGVEPISGFSAEEVVWMGRYPHRGRLGRGDAAGPDAVARALARVDAVPLAGEPFSSLSGGEQQRVRIARTLATDAPALLLDEPTAGLDPRHVLDLLAILRAEAAAGRVVALTLHDLDLAHRHCDRLVVLAAGRVAADGPARCVLGPALVQRVFGVRAAPLEDGGRRALLLERLERPPRPKGGRSPRACGPK